MAILRHATPRANLAGIRQHGLLANKSKGKLKAVWLHSAHKSGWAYLHVAVRHGADLHQVVLLEVDVPRAWLRRNRRGLWFVKPGRDVPPERIKRLIELAEVAA
jgi:hypothetical protein